MEEGIIRPSLFTGGEPRRVRLCHAPLEDQLEREEIVLNLPGLVVLKTLPPVVLPSTYVLFPRLVQLF